MAPFIYHTGLLQKSKQKGMVFILLQLDLTSPYPKPVAFGAVPSAQ